MFELRNEFKWRFVYLYIQNEDSNCQCYILYCYEPSFGSVEAECIELIPIYVYMFATMYVGMHCDFFFRLNFIVYLLVTLMHLLNECRVKRNQPFDQVYFLEINSNF